MGVDVAVAVNIRLGKAQLRHPAGARIVAAILRRLAQYLGQFRQPKLPPDNVYRVVVERLVLPLENFLVVLLYLFAPFLNLLHQTLRVLKEFPKAVCQISLRMLVYTLHALLDDQRFG